MGLIRDFFGEDESVTDVASAGNGGVATSSANGGAVAIGDINSGGNAGNAIGVGDTVGTVGVDGGSVRTQRIFPLPPTVAPPSQTRAAAATTWRSSASQLAITTLRPFGKG